MNLAPKNFARRAFTLIELLVVIAITAILLSIILVPMFQGFNLTRGAQGYADAQDKARSLSERISREIGNAAAVRDPNGIGGTVFVRIPIPRTGEAEDGTRVDPVPGSGTTVQLPLQYSKLDLIPPAEGDPVRGPGGGYVNPVTGKEDPTMVAPKGQITLPLAPGTRLVRFWLGLRDPFRPYTNPYDGLLMARGSERDNLYVLYRAEVEPVVSQVVGGVPQIVVNGQYFDVDPNGSARSPLYDDPAFFIPNIAGDGSIIGTDAKATRIRNWLRRAVVQTEISRYDLVSAEYNASTRLVKLDRNNLPRLLPLLQFRPDRISNDPAEGQTAVRLGDEADNGLRLGPETFKTKFGAWSGGIVRLYPNNWDRTLSANAFYEVGKEYTETTTNARRYGIFGLDATSGVDDTAPNTGTLLFDSTLYLQSRRSGRRYPFSEGVNRANRYSGWLGSTDPRVRPLFNPFTIDTERGEVRTSFGIDEIGPTNPADDLSSTTGVAPAFQLPSAVANSYAAPNADISYTPANDPVVPASPTETFDDAKYGSVNARFNKLWLDAQAGRNGVPSIFAERGIGHRFLDLRVTPTGDNIASPLDPRQGFTRTRIVPGSEEVYGPDMTAGPNYGFEVRYRRTTREVPGPNEYRINYVDLQEPDYAVTFGTANPPAAYDPTNLVSAVIQPRFKAGYLVLCSEPNVPIPAQTLVRNPSSPATAYVALPTRVRVSYRFQMTDSRDVVAVDYDTRSLISVHLTIRNFAQTNLPNPPSVSLKATATARNILR